MYVKRATFGQIIFGTQSWPCPSPSDLITPGDRPFQNRLCFRLLFSCTTNTNQQNLLSLKMKNAEADKESSVENQTILVAGVGTLALDVHLCRTERSQVRRSKLPSRAPCGFSNPAFPPTHSLSYDEGKADSFQTHTSPMPGIFFFF